ncbi:hypothetical protein V8C86DRAFT_2767840 [Haematococcus lacustris]
MCDSFAHLAASVGALVGLVSLVKVKHSRARAAASGKHVTDSEAGSGCPHGVLPAAKSHIQKPCRIVCLRCGTTEKLLRVQQLPCGSITSHALSWHSHGCAPSSPPSVAISELFLASTWHGKLTFSSLGAPALVLAASAQQHKVTLSKWTGTAEQQWTVQDGHMVNVRWKNMVLAWEQVEVSCLLNGNLQAFQHSADASTEALQRKVAHLTSKCDSLADALQRGEQQALTLSVAHRQALAHCKQQLASAQEQAQAAVAQLAAERLQLARSASQSQQVLSAPKLGITPERGVADTPRCIQAQTEQLAQRLREQQAASTSLALEIQEKDEYIATLLEKCAKQDAVLKVIRRQLHANGSSGSSANASPLQPLPAGPAQADGHMLGCQQPLGRAQQQRTQALARLSALEPTPPPPGPCLNVITSIDLSTLRGKLQALKASSAAPATPSDPVHQPASPVSPTAPCPAPRCSSLPAAPTECQLGPSPSLLAQEVVRTWSLSPWQEALQQHQHQVQATQAAVLRVQGAGAEALRASSSLAALLLPEPEPSSWSSDQEGEGWEGSRGATGLQHTWCSGRGEECGDASTASSSGSVCSSDRGASGQGRQGDTGSVSRVHVGRVKAVRGAAGGTQCCWESRDSWSAPDQCPPHSALCTASFPSAANPLDTSGAEVEGEEQDSAVSPASTQLPCGMLLKAMHVLRSTGKRHLQVDGDSSSEDEQLGLCV